MHRLRKLRFLLVYPLVLWLFLSAHTTEFCLTLGAILVAMGVLVRCWANGYVGHVKVNWTQHQRGDSPIGRLITGGPYAYVRHPLYLGTFLIGLGFCVIVGNVWLGAAAFGFFLLIYGRKMAQEERLLLDELGDTYAAYHHAVPRWIPRLRRYPHRVGQWSWRGITASQELKTVMWVIVFVLLLYFREELLQQHEPFWGRSWMKHLALLVILVGLILVDGLLEFVKRRSKPAPQ